MFFPKRWNLFTAGQTSVKKRIQLQSIFNLKFHMHWPMLDFGCILYMC